MEDQMIKDLELLIKSNKDDIKVFTNKLNTLIKFWKYELKENT
tara:strand:+ start:39 stop:167 length:129 start_codon:yes stop_codon:yes gene_type:complete